MPELSEPSGTSKWLEITRPSCSLQPPLGPVDVVRVLVSLTTRVYQLQVLYPIPHVVERFKGICRIIMNSTQDIMHIQNIYIAHEQYTMECRILQLRKHNNFNI